MAWVGDLLQRERRRQLGHQRLLAAVHLGHRLAHHLDVPHRELPLVAGEVVVVDAEGLLEDGRVGLLGDRQHRLAVVEHVVAPDLVGAVGEAVRVLVVGRAEQQLGRVRRAAGDDDDVGAVASRAAPSRSTTHLGDRGPGRVGAQRHGRGVGQQRDVGVLERGSHAQHLGVGLGVHQAREAVAGRAAHARAVGHVRLVEHHAAGRVEGVQAGRGEVVGELLDARLVRDRRERVGRAGGRFGRVLAARAVHLVELLGLACSRAPSPRRRSATRARCRRGGAARRSPLCGSGTAPPRTAWWRRRRSSAPAAGRACRRASYQVSGET